MQSRARARPAAAPETTEAQGAATAHASVSNRSMSRLLAGAPGASGAAAAAPQALSLLARATAPEGGTEPAPETEAEQPPVEVAEQFVPVEGNAMTEDGLGVRVVIDGEAPAGAPQSGFVDGGRIGGGVVGATAGPHGTVPRAYLPIGRTGSVAWAGGGGAGPHGNEAVSSVQLAIPPVYRSVSYGLTAPSQAWVLPGTGLIMVFRSFVGSNAGDQGNGWWVTPAAVTKLDQHEQTHVEMTRLAYNLHLAPVEGRMADTKFAFTQAGAIEDLKNHIGWEDGMKNFQTMDDTFNFPMKIVDTADLASGTYVVDSGPGTVAGTAFAHRLRIPSEPNPAP